MRRAVADASQRAVNLPRSSALVLLRVYQYALSPLIGPRCRFIPSCSAYAIDALSAHGFVRGSLLAARRLVRCHPWHPGGYDPCPAPRADSRETIQ